MTADEAKALATEIEGQEVYADRSCQLTSYLYSFSTLLGVRLTLIAWAWSWESALDNLRRRAMSKTYSPANL